MSREVVNHLMIGECPARVVTTVGYDHNHQEEFIDDVRVYVERGSIEEEVYAECDVTEQLSRKGWAYVHDGGIEVPQRKAVAQ